MQTIQVQALVSMLEVDCPRNLRRKKKIHVPLSTEISSIGTSFRFPMMDCALALFVDIELLY